MGFLWDLIQESQIRDQKSTTQNLSARVEELEAAVRRMQGIQRQLIERLEEHFGDDIDGDGKVGQS